METNYRGLLSNLYDIRHVLLSANDFHFAVFSLSYLSFDY